MASLQHHGENLLAAVHAFGNQDLSQLTSDQDAVYFDVFGSYLVYWPENQWPGILLISILCFGFVVSRFKTRLSIEALLWGFGGVLMALAGLFASSAFASLFLGQMSGLHPTDHPNPWPARICLVALSILATGVSATILRKRSSAHATFVVVWFIFLLLTCVSSILLSGSSYLFVVPTLATLLIGAAALVFRPLLALRIAAYAGLLLASYMSIYHFYLIDTVINFERSEIKVIPLVLMTLAALPVFFYWFESRQRSLVSFQMILSGITLVAGIVAYNVPAYSYVSPRGTNIIYQSNSAEADSHWQIEFYGPIDEEYLAAGGFPEQKAPFLNYGVIERQGFLLSAEKLDLPEPRLVITEDIETVTGRRLVGTVQSQRLSSVLGLIFMEGDRVEGIRIEGQKINSWSESVGYKFRVAWIYGVGRKPVNFTLNIRGQETSNITVFDEGPLPITNRAKHLEGVRPMNAAPIFDGDRSIVTVSSEINQAANEQLTAGEL